MDLALAAVAETLACEFRDLCGSTVVEVLTECANEYPYDGPHFIEQAARARLSIRSQSRAAWPGGRPRDALDVSLHDRDLADEVELTSGLMIAANDANSRLSLEVVDRILGVTRAPSSRVLH